MWGIFWCAVALGISGALTFLLRGVARRLQLLDAPTSPRKIHKKPVPLIGGVALASGVAMTIFLATRFSPTDIVVLPALWWLAAILATLLILLVGILDDRFRLPPALQLLGPIGAALLVLVVGIKVATITNPLGGIMSLAIYAWLPAGLTFCWLVGLMESVKLLDGLDGLATGLTTITALLIFALTQTNAWWQPRVGVLALILAGACLGFLLGNWHPARAFLGEGGAVFLGFALGLLAILSGSKIATTLLVMGLPVFDLARLMVVRTWRGHSPFAGDQLHLHHLLWRTFGSQRTAVLIYWGVGLVFGVSALLLPSLGKMIALVVMMLFTWGLAGILQHRLRA